MEGVHRKVGRFQDPKKTTRRHAFLRGREMGH